MAGEAPSEVEAPGTPLSKELREATKKAHSITNVVTVAKLAVVLTDRVLYGQALSAFYPVYRAIEAKVEAHQKLPALAPLAVVMEKVRRTAALEADLNFYLGTNWQSLAVTTPAVGAYVAHLDALEAEDAALLLPYAYQNYVPLVLGLMGKQVKRTLNLPDNEGIAFHKFPGTSALLPALRGAVDEGGLALTSAQRARVCQEAVSVFKLNDSVVRSFKAGAVAWFRASTVLARLLPLWLLLALVALATLSVAFFVAVAARLQG